MPTVSVTMTVAESCLLTPVTQVDQNGTPLAVPDPTYGAPVFTNSNTAVIAMVGARATFAGTLGTATITATESSPGKPDITGEVVITVDVPVAAAGLEIGTLIQQGN